MKTCILFDHDGVLVDTEFWYYDAGKRALADIGLTLDKDQYLRDMSQGLGTWAQARAAGVDERTINQLREIRNGYYQEYLRAEPIEIDGVVDALAGLAQHARMAIVTTAKRVDFDIIHENRYIRQCMEFVLVREDYQQAKPHPEPYLTGLKRFEVTAEEALVVEDSSRGLASAVAAGIDCAIVGNAFTQTQDFSQARYRIDTLIELKDILLQEAGRQTVGVPMLALSCYPGLRVSGRARELAGARRLAGSYEVCSGNSLIKSLITSDNLAHAADAPTVRSLRLILEPFTSQDWRLQQPG